MKPEYNIPKSTPVAIALIKNKAEFSAHGGRVSTSLSQILPAVRVRLIYHVGANRWERKPVFQIEAWASTEGAAEDLATVMFNHWPSFRGTFGSVEVSGAWNQSDGPIPMPDQNTNLFRFQFEAGLSIGVANV